MFGRAIWDKLPESIFENFKIAQAKRWQFQNFQKLRATFIRHERVKRLIPNFTRNFKES